MESNEKKDHPEIAHPAAPEKASVETEHAKKQSSPKRFLLPVLLVVIILALGSFWAYQTNTKNKPVAPVVKALEKVSIRLNWIHNACFAGLYVAKEKGFYKDAGLDVTIKDYQDGLDQTAEAGDNKVDFALSTPIETLLSIDEGKKLTTIAAINQISPEAFASLQKTNIKVQTDLRGKVLGVHGGNKEAEAIYNALLSQANLKKTDVTFKTIGYDHTIAEFLSNRTVDLIGLYRTDDTYELDNAGLSYNLLLPENFGVVGYGDTIVTSNTQISQNPERVKKFVQATMKGWEYAIAHQDEALQITKHYEESEYKNAAREKYVLEHYVKLMETTGGKAMGSMSYIIWNQSVQELQSQDLIKHKIDPSQVYTNQFITN